MTGKLGHVILTDHVVHNGQIQDITEQHLFLLNPTRHTHTFALETIQEVIFDKETDF